MVDNIIWSFAESKVITVVFLKLSFNLVESTSIYAHKMQFEVYFKLTNKVLTRIILYLLYYRLAMPSFDLNPQQFLV